MGASLLGLPTLSALATSPMTGIRWHMPLVLAFASICFAAMWAFFAFQLQATLSWLSVLAALDIAWFARMIGWPYRDSRPMVAMVFTALTIVLANLWLASVLFTSRSSFSLWQGLAQIASPETFLKIRLMNSATDWFWYGLSLFLASVLASRPDRNSAEK